MATILRRARACNFPRSFSTGAVSIDSIKELRRRSGAPIAAVKLALLAENGDHDAAFQHLRKLGASLAAKRAAREATEGLVGVAVSEDRRTGAIVELNSETDFVARTDEFSDVLKGVLHSALAHGIESGSGVSTSLGQELDVEELVSKNGNAGKIAEAAAVLGENIRVRRASVLRANSADGMVSSYVHGGSASSIGRIGALVVLEGSSDVVNVGLRAAMHVAAASPLYLNRVTIPQDEIMKEEGILLEAAKAEQNNAENPKPDEILMRMVKGRMKKWYQQVALSEQEMMVEPLGYAGSSRTVLESLRHDCQDANVVAFARFAIL